MKGATLLFLLTGVLALRPAQEDKDRQRRQLDFDGGGGGVNDYLNGDIEEPRVVKGEAVTEANESKSRDGKVKERSNGEQEFWRSVSITVLSRPGRSQGLLYKHRWDSFIH